MIASLEGVDSRLWRVEDPAAVAAEVAAVQGPLVIADGLTAVPATWAPLCDRFAQTTGNVRVLLTEGHRGGRRPTGC